MFHKTLPRSTQYTNALKLGGKWGILDFILPRIYPAKFTAFTLLVQITVFLGFFFLASIVNENWKLKLGQKEDNNAITYM